MPPTIKENDTLTATSETAARTASAPVLPGDAFKQQPVALEVEVSVNGARTIEGSDKREPFSETTKTVLVFGNGAVIRLSSSVAPGQLLFLTNERTKKEVVCQVVKSKNYRNVSGYVELEFTESVVGFWGMRFPGDRIGSGPQIVPAAPAAVRPSAVGGSPLLQPPSAPKLQEPAASIPPSVTPARPATPAPVSRELQPKLSQAKFVVPESPVTQVSALPKLETPVKPVPSLVPSLPATTSQLSEVPLTGLPTRSSLPVPPTQTIPEVTVNPVSEQANTPASVTFDFPRASEVQASILEPPRLATPSPASTMMATTFNPAPEVKPEAPAVPLSPAPSDAETEVLKQHTARLQEQLSSMLFAEPAPPLVATPVEATVAATAPPIEPKELLDTAAQVLEIAKTPDADPIPTKLAEPAIAPAVILPSSLDEEELKIPAWLEPLARNASAPSSTQELILREKARRFSEQGKTEEIVEEPVASLEEQAVEELRIPSFGNALPMDEETSTVESPSTKSGKGLLIWAIAAGVLLLAGVGWWYMNQQSGGIHASAKPAPQAQVPAVSLPAESLQTQAQGKTAPQTNVSAQTNSTEQSTTSGLNNAAAPSNSAANPLSAAPNGATTSPAHNSQATLDPANGSTVAATSASAQPAQVKKPILGELHLATPNVAQKRTAQNSGEAEVGLALGNDQPETNTDGLSTGLVGASSQPAAPAAPAPVGGDVKPAKLISSVAPSYPALARSQHVSGNVLIDALIDASGHVTTMKVVSGPALLHQAAMDAVRQWKYQPATLGGNPTTMHLTVTIQFRPQ